jgi:putative ABC transport system substrate-binding protein
MVGDMRDVAHKKGVRLSILSAGTESEIDAAFVTFTQRQASALVVTADAFLVSRRAQLVAVTARHAVPAIYPFREFATSGGLISYGPSIWDAWRQAGVYVGKILQGIPAGELPVTQPTTFELVINLNTAKALGLTVPPSLLARADEVIE